ncbi:hypothetical protein FHW79_001685 [Azospirillum sp. OGB3]|uniref:hypothetical protein n=1 Tax=Azospirillum sp. OGB3 TaxID=2587012 RepID=UPI00160562CC|nr:hypothetical protein [Azospirillum sp. OGB3]MBB3264070.1 hypothetical protein [Azospirillum sp. OGB3]
MTERDDSGQPALPSLRALLLGTAAPLSDALSEWENDYRATEADPSLTADQRIALWMDQDNTLTKRVCAVPVRSLADAVAAAGQYLNLARQDVTAHAVPEAVAQALAEGLHAYLSEVRSTVQATEGSSTIPALAMTFADAVASIRRRWREAAEADDTESDKIAADAIRIMEAVLKADPRTPADALAQIELLADPDTGMAVGESSNETDAATIRRVYAVLAGVPSGIAAAGTGSTILPSLGMTFTQAADRIATNYAEHLALPDEDEESADRLVDEWNTIALAVSATAPQTITDALAVLRIASHPSSTLPFCDVHAEGSTAEALFGALLRAAAFLSAVLAGPVQNCPQPDAELLAAWGLWCRPDTMPDGPERQAAITAASQAEVTIETVPARTPQGAAVKAMAVVQLVLGRSPDALEGPMPEDVEDDCASRVLWTLARDLRRLWWWAPCPSAPTAAAPNGQHPDARLLTLWERYTAAVSAYDGLPDGLTDEDYEPSWLAVDALRDEIEATMPITLAGVAVRLKLHLIGLAEDAAVTPSCFGGPMPAVLNSAGDLVALWRLIEHLEGATVATGPCVTPTAPETDAFAETIAAFRTEAPASLAIPDTPTEAMVQAGAAAGGCRPEQVRTMFAAMVDAYHREAA